jgi:tetratricopeptide (TPR) repeat protein/tRNA A-37 threonylcarbamoyl transferase component Bud32
MTERSIFLDALDIPDPADRAAFLDRKCGPDADLRRRVDALLAAHAAAGEFLEPPSPARTAPHMPADQNALADLTRAYFPDTSPISVPGYEVIEELGRGGMGVVYKARQATLNRTVALKLLLGAAHTQPVAVARFLIEAEAVAAIDHPHVVRVHHYGEFNGRPFLAMEYLPGGTLTGRLKVGPLTVRVAAALVAKLAAGVAAAHALGIVHRDLKPGNVLFDGAEEPKVADFGLARRGEGTDLTRTDAVMGTPAFMPPEQFKGAKFAGPPADVWALGVILYECLTGVRPFKGGDLDEMFNRIAQDDPTPPRRLAPMLHRDLELICLKCLAKAPSDRYPTAADLADDLNQFLDWKPVSVRVVGPVDRAILWGRRNPMVAGLLALVVVSLVMGTTVSYLNYLDARTQEGIAQGNAQDAAREAREARRQQEIAIAQQKRAEKARDRTLKVLDTMTSKITGDSLATQKEITAEQKNFLAEVVKYYEEFARENGDDEVSRKRIAWSAYRVGLIEYRLGSMGKSDAAYDLAQNRFSALVADFPTVPEYRAGLAKSHNNLGVVHQDLKKWTEAEEQYRKALAIREKLVADFPTDPEYLAYLAQSHSNLGVLLDQVHKAGTEEQYDKALAIREKLAADAPNDLAKRAELAHIYGNKGIMLYSQGIRHNRIEKQVEAEKLLRQALAIFEELTAESPTDHAFRAELAQSHNNLGFMLQGLKKWTEAEEQYRKALAIREKLVVEFPAVPNFRQGIVSTLYNFARLYAAWSQVADKNQEYADRAMELLQKAVKAGYTNGPQMAKDTGLDPLRNRADFKLLLESLSKPKPKE